MTELEAIYARHSVRSYLPEKPAAEKLLELKELIAACNREGNLHLQLLENAGNTFNRGLHKLTGLGTAPCAVACVGPEDDTLEERIGYYGERVVLRAQQLGLNTCWVGMYRKDGVPAEVCPGERLVITIALGCGAVQGKPHKSKKPERLAGFMDGRPEWYRLGAELAMLAPTAVNQQSFLIEYREDGSVVFSNLGGPFSKVDLGIVKYHFEVGKAAAGSGE